MRSIGGYHGLELPGGRSPYGKLMHLNTARNALEYILRMRRFRKIFIPTYTCEVLMEPIKKLNLSYEKYSIDMRLEPIFRFEDLSHDEAFLYTNYFALKDLFINKLKDRCSNLIIDNAQAFFSQPLQGIDTYYSPRKYFGVPDGAYLSIDRHLALPLPKDVSVDRFKHLLHRIDISAEEGFKFFKENDESMANQEIKEMSNITQHLLASIDYNSASKIRKENFDFLHRKLGVKNQLDSSLLDQGSLFCYPLLVQQGGYYRKELIRRQIYVPTYWPNIRDHVSSDSSEATFIDGLVCLPIDQRYNLDDMRYISEQINEIEHGV